MLQKAKKFCGVLMALAILTTMLAGCDSKSNKSQNSVDGTSSVAAANNLDPLSGEGKNGTIQLKVWAPDAAVSIFNKQCKAFIEKYKDFGTIKISVVPQGEADAATSVLTDPDSAADVFGFACDNIDKLQATDSLLPIVGNDKTKTEEENIKAAVDAATINGKLYAYPETGDNSYCLVYDNSVVS
ncbi:MAG: extracellular solute-binding protein, partial [Clostridia bacterium]|nr:extracellular solute-binding protein [Clostridia bacterium]